MPPPAHALASRLIAGPTLRTQSDRRLVRLVREGYESAFEEIVRRYGRALGRYAAGIVGARSEDVTQDAFSKALLALRRDDTEIELRPWLYRIVRNTALNDLRDRPAAAVELAESIAAGRTPAETIEQREELAELMTRLRALPEAQRAAIVMRELEGLNHEEIAAALGLSGGGARQAIYRARRALRDGIGMLIPLPLLKAMLFAGAAGSADVAAGAAGIGGAAGAGMALKATAATVFVAGAVGTGVALHDGAAPIGEREMAQTPGNGAAGDFSSSAAGTAPLTTGAEGGQGGQIGDDRGHGRGENETGDDHGSSDSPEHHGGDSGPDGVEGHSGSDRPESSGHDGGGSRNDSGHGVERSGPGGGSGSESDDSGHGGSGSGGDSGSGSSGPGPEGDSPGGGSGSGGPGSGEPGDFHEGDGFFEETEPPLEGN
jgi:RNA polymerase sigma factor (sigma-70 family)